MRRESKRGYSQADAFLPLIMRLPVGLAVIERDTRLISANASASMLLGLQEEIQAKKLSDFVSVETEFLSKAESFFTGDFESTIISLPAKKADGTIEYLEITLVPLDENPRTRALALISRKGFTDDTKIEGSRERSEAAIRTKSEFLAKMSHEIRTPIHSIVGITELLGETKLDAEQREYLERIEFSAESLLAIVNDILDFSKIEAGKIGAEILDFDLHAVIENAVDMLTIEAHKKGIDLELFIDDKVPRIIRGDSDHLRQVIANLLSNAIKFTLRGEVLVSVKTLAFKADSYELEFRVKDTGIGIKPDQLTKLFQAFTQADNSTSRKYGGTGLGLAISRGLVDLMGGTIGAKSTFGTGSEFYFSVPFAKSSQAVTDEAQALLFEGTRILLVSGNTTLKTILTRYINPQGGEVEEVSEGGEALKALKASAQREKLHDICLVELRLSDMDGWQLASEINADKSINGTRLVLLSPKDKGSGEAKMRELGWFDSFISTPIKRSELFAALLRATNTDIDLASVGDEMPESAPGAFGTEEESFAGISVLVVEDNEINSQLFKVVLENMGIKVTLATDGIEAVKRARMLLFDLIFMDIQMPIKNGYEATKEIRASGSRVPIIAVTANALKSEVEQAFDSGMDDYITKPFKKKDITPVLSKWLLQTGTHREEEASGYGKEIEKKAVSSFDYTKALESFLGNKALLSEVVAKFAAKVKGQIGLIEKATEESASLKVRAEAHSIKGAAWNLSAFRLGDTAARLEEAASQGEASQFARHLAEIKEELRLFEVAVKASAIELDVSQ